ncbi:MAG: hypothetical protein G3M78_09750 [Candidatus Nitrohelix vancouverensis]|uniref:Secreted protein n=1 Tax=Candidatus Nitrohelix vancouverensis TaxID=2705534 RepID=A0A7T0C332_9BACT|nr:MAG: hypothetical protein G3M78_09750 [Candidatus Nitrohelix vancouverensis]
MKNALQCLVVLFIALGVAVGLQACTTTPHETTVQEDKDRAVKEEIRSKEADTVREDKTNPEYLNR